MKGMKDLYIAIPLDTSFNVTVADTLRTIVYSNFSRNLYLDIAMY